MAVTKSPDIDPFRGRQVPDVAGRFLKERDQQKRRADLTADTGKPQSEHVAVSRIVLFGGHTRELIHVDKAFLIAAIQDARSWCHEMEGPGGSSGPTAGQLADYDAALAVLEAGP